jgi:hypothetical protein
MCMTIQATITKNSFTLVKVPDFTQISNQYFYMQFSLNLHSMYIIMIGASFIIKKHYLKKHSDASAIYFLTL